MRSALGEVRDHQVSRSEPGLRRPGRRRVGALGLAACLVGIASVGPALAADDRQLAPTGALEREIEDEPEFNDTFGDSVATGDFNGDGAEDLALGVPGQGVGDVPGAGAVHVIYGSSTAGLTTSAVLPDQFLHQAVRGIADQPEVADRFGAALAGGDFNGDGIDDLAIGVSLESVKDAEDAGAVHVIYGSAAAGLSPKATRADQLFHQNKRGMADDAELDDEFGLALTAGDFNGDGRDDLVIGVPNEDFIADLQAGAAHVLYGSARRGLTAGGATPSQFWHQDVEGVEGETDDDDEFGTALAAGDFNGDGQDDIAIGVRGELVNTLHAGAVNVLYGSAGVGLAVDGTVADQLWHQDAEGVDDSAEAGDGFGHSVAGGDFNGDGADDLAVGAVFESVNEVGSTGAVNVIYGSKASGLSTTSVLASQFWHQDVPDVEDVVELSDQFGAALASGDFNGDGQHDLVLGTPAEDLTGAQNAGAIHVIYGSAPRGLAVTGVVDDQFWRQGVGSVEDEREFLDVFGLRVGSGDFNGDGNDDLVGAATWEDLGAADAAGAVNVIYGSDRRGLHVQDVLPDQFWHQGSAD